MAHVTVQSSVSTDTTDGISWHGSSPAYSIRRTSGTWSAPPYEQLKIDFGTGIKIDPGQSYDYAHLAIMGATTIGRNYELENASTNAPNGLIVEGKVGIGTTAPACPLNVTTENGGYQVKYSNDSGAAQGLQVRIKGNDDATLPALDVETWDTGTTYTSKFRVQRNGNVGIGDSSPSYKLEVAGTFYSSGSSIEYKEDVEPYTPPEGALMSLKPVQYQYKDAWKDFGKRYSGNSSRQIGFVAEDVAKILPELAVTKSEDGEEVVRNVDYEKLTVLLVSEVQKLRTELNEIKNASQ